MTQNNEDFDFNVVENRNQIIFLYDGKNANLNGNPMSGDDSPRIDPVTNHCYVTDVRLKRYIRDELHARGRSVYVANIRQSDGSSPTREFLAERIAEADGELADLLNGIEIGDDTDVDDVLTVEEIEAAFERFLDEAVDVRMFGATFSLSVEEDSDTLRRKLDEILPNVTGAVQFSPGESMHEVTENVNYDNLTSVIGTKEDKETGGYDLDDKRVQYAMVKFAGVVDQRRAENTRLRQSDLELLDDVVWGALKNQTVTRSKTGQEPQFYARVEYTGDATHIGRLDDLLTKAEQDSKSDEEMRTTTDMVVDFTDFISTVQDNADRIKALHVRAGPMFNARAGDWTGSGDEVVEMLDSEIDAAVQPLPQ